jgi:hypothetical protein
MGVNEGMPCTRGTDIPDHAQNGETAMLTITVNGCEEKLNIGCRTFIALDELLRILSVAGSAVTLNGTKISSSTASSTFVKGGDSLAVPGLGR